MGLDRSIQPTRDVDANADLIGSAANPKRIDPTGTTTQPISAASLPLPAGAATEATLAARLTQATGAAIQAVLEAIRDTAGIKKIVDALPIGDNWIGRTKIGDGTTTATVIDDTENPSTEKRLQTESRLAPGSTVNIGTGVPSNPSDFVVDYCRSGGSPDLRVDGDPTPVDFDFGADPTDDLAVEELQIVFSADDMTFDGASFATDPELSNGILIQTIVGGVTTTLKTITLNEQLLELPGRPPIVNNTGPKDLLEATVVFGGVLRLGAGTADKIRIKVQDDLTGVKYKYFRGQVTATKT